MIDWRTIPSERFESYSPIGLRLIDDFTGQAPIEKVRADLYVSDGSGGWQRTDIKVKRSAGGILIYPGLERRSNPVGLPPGLYRVTINAEFYRPLYRSNAFGIEFEAFPYNDSNPPRDYRVSPPLEINVQIQDVRLTPSVNYPMPANVSVLRGVVSDVNGFPLPDIEVSQGVTERTLTDDKGTYGLPLRWSANGVQFPIDAIDHRTARTGSINITLPQDLGSNQTITIS